MEDASAELCACQVMGIPTAVLVASLGRRETAEASCPWRPEERSRMAKSGERWGCSFRQNRWQSVGQRFRGSEQAPSAPPAGAGGDPPPEGEANDGIARGNGCAGAQGSRSDAVASSASAVGLPAPSVPLAASAARLPAPTVRLEASAVRLPVPTAQGDASALGLPAPTSHLQDTGLAMQTRACAITHLGISDGPLSGPLRITPSCRLELAGIGPGCAG